MAANFQAINKPSTSGSSKNQPLFSFPSTSEPERDEKKGRQSTEKPQRSKASPLFLSSPPSTEYFPDISDLLSDSLGKHKACQDSTLQRPPFRARTPKLRQSQSRFVRETPQGKFSERSLTPRSSPRSALIRVASEELSSPTHNGTRAYPTISEPMRRYHLSREVKLMQSIEAPVEQERHRETTMSTSASSPGLPSSEYHPSSVISMGPSPSRSIDGHRRSSPATSIPSSKPSADEESKPRISSRSTTPDLELPTYLYGLERKDPRAKAYKKSLIAQLRAIKLEMSSMTSQEHSQHSHLEDPLQDRASKLDGRMAELVMQIEVMLREGLITGKDKVLQVANECVPPETDCHSTAMDLRSLLSQMQSDGFGVLRNHPANSKPGAEGNSNTHKLGDSALAQSGSRPEQEARATVNCKDKRLSATVERSDGHNRNQNGVAKNASQCHSPGILSSRQLFGRARDPSDAKGFNSQPESQCGHDETIERGSKAADTVTRSKDLSPSRPSTRINLPIPKGPRSMFPTRGEDVLTGCNIIPVGRHPRPSQTRGIEVQIPMRKNNPIPRWHVGHSEWQRRRELSAWRVGGTYSHSGDSDDALTTHSATGREVSTIPSYEFYGASQRTPRQPQYISFTNSPATTDNASSDHQRLNNGDVTSDETTFPRIQRRKSEKSKNLIALAECSQSTSKQKNLDAPQDPIGSSSQTGAKRRRHVRQDSSESRSSSSQQIKRLKSTHHPRGSSDGSAEDSGDGQLDIDFRDLAGALTSARTSLKDKCKATQPLDVSSPFGSKTFSSDPARHSDFSPAFSTNACSLGPLTLHNRSNATIAPPTNDAHFDSMDHDSFPPNLDEDPETVDLQRLQPFPSLPSRTALHGISLNIPSMRFRSMPPPRAMGPPLHRRLLQPQVSNIVPLSIKDSIHKALKECLQENQGALQALLPQPQPVIVNPLPLPGTVRHRGDTHHFGNLDQEQVIAIVKNPNLGRAIRYSSAPTVFTYKGTVRENYQWLGAEGLFTEPEWKRVGGKMKNFSPRVE